MAQLSPLLTWLLSPPDPPSTLQAIGTTGMVRGSGPRIEVGFGSRVEDSRMLGTKLSVV